jgi:hypothetical protein
MGSNAHGLAFDERGKKTPSRASWLVRAKRRAMEQSREKKVDQFYSLCGRPGAVLDVGVCHERNKLFPAQNYFLKTFRYPSAYYTGLGIDDMTGLEQMYPGWRFVRYPGGCFPFTDKQFDWAFSNAVIEHVGSEADQVLFVNEMLRVARNVFFTTPNKYFPVESHTNVFFLHWKDSLFYDWCARHKPGWKRKNLYLFSRQRLRAVMERSKANHCRIYANRLFGLPMTFTVVCSE